VGDDANEQLLLDLIASVSRSRDFLPFDPGTLAAHWGKIGPSSGAHNHGRNRSHSIQAAIRG
jgi:hypothetical protein